MKSKNTYIDAGKQDMSRPKERPPKKTWKTELIKISLRVYQYFNSKAVAEIIWKYFTTPVEPRFTPKQQEIVDQAVKSTVTYLDCKITSYRWGKGKKKVLLSHGWNSKVADFRRMILALVEAGYTVEGIDMKAHGQSEGRRSALPEFRDILKAHYLKNNGYYAVVGYSLGGIAAAIAMAEVPEKLLPKKLFIIATPPFVRYFFENVVKNDVGCNHQVYETMSQLVEKYYGESIDYFDLRNKKSTLEQLDLHLIYDEDDQTVPFARGEELKSHFPKANWVHTRGLGHYKVIAHHKVIDYIKESLEERELVENH